MRFLRSIVGAMAALFGFSSASMEMRDIFRPEITPMRLGASGKKPKRRKSGEKYPHSSTRQRARYARQLAAGQLSMAGVEGGDA
jgi:hypothetical protein